MAPAIRNTLGRMPNTMPYAENGFLELDNLKAEYAVNHVVIGRWNWMFAGSESGDQAMVAAFALIE